jgi:hypothetical protein
MATPSLYSARAAPVRIGAAFLREGPGFLTRVGRFFYRRGGVEGTDRSTRDVAIPAVGLASLRTALLQEVGPLQAIHALHAAGFGTGEALWESLRRGPGRELSGLEESSFWPRLAAALGRRGGGTLTHQSPHPGVGLLASTDWAEALGTGGERQPSCTFSSGMLSAILSGVAGGPVAVLEVTCRTKGDERCTFAFGSAETVHDLYGLLLDGEELDSALSAL